MSDSEDREAGLAMLLVDVLAGEDEDTELLLRYAQDPEQLLPEEREQVERALSVSPAYKDQLRVLRRLAVKPSREDSRE